MFFGFGSVSVVRVLRVESRYIVHLRERNGNVLVRALFEVGRLVVAHISAAVVVGVVAGVVAEVTRFGILPVFGPVELVQHVGCRTPADQVEESLVLHCQLQTTLEAHGLPGVFLRPAALGIGRNFAKIFRIINTCHRIFCTGADFVDQRAGLLEILVQFDKCFGADEHDVGIAQYDLVHAECLPGLVVGDVGRPYGAALLHGAVPAVAARRARVGIGEDDLLVVLVRETAHGHGVEETGIDLLGLYARVGVRDPAAVVEVVEHRKSVAGLEGIDQILRGLQEVVPARE